MTKSHCELWLRDPTSDAGPHRTPYGFRVSVCCATGFRTQNKGLHDACPGHFYEGTPWGDAIDCGCPCHTVKPLMVLTRQEFRDALRAALRRASRECASEPERESAVLTLKAGGKTWQVALQQVAT